MKKGQKVGQGVWKNCFSEEGPCGEEARQEVEERALQPPAPKTSAQLAYPLASRLPLSLQEEA